MTDALAEHDVACVRADNPGPMTLSGTNTWVAGHDPAWVVDPGPLSAEHVEAVLGAGEARGGIAGIVITHDHRDHTEAAPELAARAGGVPVFAAVSSVASENIGDGDAVGPFRAVATPGHSPDHLAFLFGGALFCGDAILGEGSVIIVPGPGALRGYLAALERLLSFDLTVLCPGHGPPIHDPRAKISEYIAHRLERERMLVEALDAGLRGVDEILDFAWADVPPVLRPAAAVTLRTHADKLAEEGRLPSDVELGERPVVGEV